MEWKTRFPVGLFLLAALMLAGGVSAATSMRVAAAHHKATAVLASHGESEEPTETGDREESEPAEESDPAQEFEPAEGDDQGGHGGTVDRFHEGCELPEGVAALEGNWTHGDYVSAYAKGEDREAHVAAAHSPCGKPTKAAEKDKTDHNDKASKGKAHANAAKHGNSKGHNS